MEPSRASFNQERTEGIGGEGILAALEGEEHLVLVLPNNDLNSLLEKTDLNDAIIGLHGDGVSGSLSRPPLQLSHSSLSPKI